MFFQEYLFDPEAQAGLTVYLHEEKPSMNGWAIVRLSW